MVKRRNKGEIKMTEREKMELGMWYDANNDEELLKQISKIAEVVGKKM